MSDDDAIQGGCAAMRPIAFEFESQYRLELFSFLFWREGGRERERNLSKSSCLRPIVLLSR